MTRRMDAMTVPPSEHAHALERRTWQSLLFGTVVWFAHLNLVYGLNSVSCKWSWFSFNIAGIPGLQFVQALLTLVAAALLGVMIYLPWREWRAYQSEAPRDNPNLLQDTEKDRRPLVAFITMLLNSLYLLFMLANLVTIFALQACSQA
jgi:hypothetical protein